MSSISNHTTVPSVTATHMLAVNSQNPAPISDRLRTDLEELKTLLNRLNNAKDPGLIIKLKEEFNIVLDKYCGDGGPDQDALNKYLQQAGLVTIQTSPYEIIAKPSKDIDQALDNNSTFDIIVDHIIPEIDKILAE